MVFYAESSAVLAWLFSEAEAAKVIARLEEASLIVTSELTSIECARAIHRAHSGGLITDVQSSALRSEYANAVAQWDLLPLGDRVAHLASAPWPVEPVRALDAIHLASILVARDAWRDLRVMTRDQRISANVTALGIGIAQTE